MDKIFYDIYLPLPRLGPGSRDATLRALSYVSLGQTNPRVLDIGCGTGAQTLDLARILMGAILALDNYQPFLDIIRSKAAKEPLRSIIEYYCGDMNNLAFAPGSFDLVWAEGSIYIIGFRKGLDAIRPLLKENGYAMFSDMNWLRDDPPKEAVELFRTECPDMMNVQQNIELIRRSSYELVQHFPLSEQEHWDFYYGPLEQRLASFRKEHAADQKAQDLFDSIQHEVDVYRRCSSFFGYTFYVMKKR
jgi:SAM-dependent methyltransferase